MKAGPPKSTPCAPQSKCTVVSRCILYSCLLATGWASREQGWVTDVEQQPPNERANERDDKTAVS